MLYSVAKAFRGIRRGGKGVGCVKEGKVWEKNGEEEGRERWLKGETAAEELYYWEAAARSR